MKLLLYGIAEAHDHGVPGEGLDRRPLRGIVEGPLLAVVSEHDGADLRPTGASVRAYEHTVRQLCEGGAILPARFGSVLEDEPAIRELLVRRRQDLLARLRRVRGAVEIALRASWTDGVRARPDPHPESGTAYLRDRLELRQGAARVASDLEPLAAVALGRRRELEPRSEVSLLDAYLVDQERVDEFVALVEQLDGRLDDVDLVCTGPWPPYSFADGAPV